jgi:ligand-binding sensor domain-containing protein
MKLISILSSIVALLFSCVNEQRTSPTAVAPVVSTEISNPQVTAFAEDSVGHIWIGTLRGLNKNTVNEFQQYFSSDNPQSLVFDQVTQLFRDSKNRLWVGTRNGICIYASKDNFERIPIESASQYVLEIAESDSGEIFINTIEQLCKFHEDTRKFTTVLPNLATEGNWNTRIFTNRHCNASSERLRILSDNKDRPSTVMS